MRSWVETIALGSRRIVAHMSETRITARLYVNDGTTPTLLSWTGKTSCGLHRWATRVLGTADGWTLCRVECRVECGGAQ